MLGLKHLLKGLILLLIVSNISCGTKEPDVITAKISTKYYMLKNPSPKDEILLTKYSKSTDEKLANEAKCLLAGYYVKSKKFNESNKIFNNSSSKLFDDSKFGVQLSYWRIISDIENGKSTKVSDIESIKGSKNSILINDLCSNYSKRSESVSVALCPKDKEELAVDTDKVILSTDLNDSLESDETNKFMNIVNTQKIVIKNTKQNNSLIKGLLFSIKENNLNFEILQEGIEAEDTVIIDGDSRVIEFKDAKIAFKSDLSNDSETIFNFVWNKDPEIVVIGINDRSATYGVELRDRLVEMGVQVIILNYEIPSFRSKLSIISEEYSEKYVYFIGFGSEESMTKFVPIVKFMNEKPEEVEIGVVTDLFSNMFFLDQFKGYFKNVEVMTYVEVNQNYWSKKFQNGYKFFYDEEPDSDAYIGFDMALKLSTFLDKNKKDDYVSNIDLFNDIGAVRALKNFKIIDYNKIKVISN